MIGLTRFLAIGAFSLLSACGALGGKHVAFTVYSPQISTTPKPESAPTATWQLLIDTPRASAALDTTHISIMPAAGLLEVYPAARWRDSAAQMLRSLIVQAFDDSGRFSGVSSTGAGMRGDFTLAIELRDFQIELHGAAAHAAIRLTAKLFNHRDNRIVATRIFNVQAPAAGVDVGSAFSAFEQALNQLMPDLIDWTAQQGSTYEPTSTPAAKKPGSD